MAASGAIPATPATIAGKAAAHAMLQAAIPGEASGLEPSSGQCSIAIAECAAPCSEGAATAGVIASGISATESNNSNLESQMAMGVFLPARS